MATDITRITFTLSSIMQGGLPCKNPTITWDAPQGVDVVCDPENDFQITVTLSPDATSHCVTFTIDCDDCDECPSQTFTECFCVNSDDCGNCEYCDTDKNLCVSECPEGKICVGESCGDCVTADDCLCNQICIGDDCVCPPDKPYKRADDCCVECLNDTHCADGEACDGTGNCVPIPCPPNTSYNPEADRCTECTFDSDCTDPNECCDDEDYTCKCCEGFYRDANGDCVPKPPCTTGSCPDCYDCDPVLGCVPRVCPPGYICVNDNCEPACTDGNCPDGEGCINGICVPCNELSCLPGVGLQCAQAAGCGCDEDNNCVEIDCSPSDVSVVLDYVQPTIGVVTNPGLPALQGSGTVTAVGEVGPPLYQDHEFTLSIVGTTGNWILKNTPTSSQTLATGQSSVTFRVSDTGPNLYGFLVDVVAPSGVSGTFVITRNPTSAPTDSNVWSVSFSSSGTAPTTSGSVFGYTRLCVTNGNWTIDSVNYTTASGDIVVTPIGTDADGCTKLSIVGCGLATGTAVLRCGSVTTTKALPEISIPQDTCCNPQTNPNCPPGIGNPCEGLSVEEVTLLADAMGSTNMDGDGLYYVRVDFNTVPGGFLTLFYLNPSPGCWSTSADEGTLDLTITNTGFGVGENYVYLGDGGCVDFGKSCTLRVAGCKKLEGQVCLESCANFSVYIQDLGANVYKAVPSISNKPVTYAWTHPSLPTATSPQVTITPIGGETTLTVVATYGNPAECTATASLTFNVSIGGCTDFNACNYNEAANVDDGSCIFAAAPTYSCIAGFQTSRGTNNTEFQYLINGGLVTEGAVLNPGTYDVVVSGDGYQCTRELVVPQCYTCSGANCIAASPNAGPYTSNDCNNECDLCSDLEILPSWACDGNEGRLTLSGTGGSGNYNYVVKDSGGNQVQSGSFSSNFPVTISDLCNGSYTFVVVDAAYPNFAECTVSSSNSLSCLSCANSNLAITAQPNLDYCATNAISLNITDSVSTCDNNYEVTIDTGSGNLTYNYTTDGVKSIALTLADGSYPVSIVDDNGCTANSTLVIDCAGGPTDCVIDLFTEFTSDSVTANVNVQVGTFATSGVHNWEVYQSTSPTTSPTSCASATYGATPIASGVHTGGDIGFGLPVLGPGKCYKLIVTDSADAACQATDYIFIPGLAAPVTCSVDSSCSTVTYNGTSEELNVNYAFSNTPSGVNVLIEKLDGCPSGTVLDGAFYVAPAQGQTGTLSIPVTVEPVDTYYKVTLESVDNPATCNLICCVTVPACTCDVPTVNLSYNTGTEELTVEYAVTCPTQPTDIVITLDAMTDGTCAVLDSNITSRVTSSNSGTEIFSVPLTVADQFVRVTVEDSAIGACTTNSCITIDGDDCAINFLSGTYDTDTLTVEIDFTVTNSSGNVNIELIDGTGTFVQTPAGPYPVSEGANTVSIGLNRTATDEFIQINIEDAVDATCSDGETISVCSTVAAQSVGGDSSFDNYSNSAYDSRGGLLFDDLGPNPLEVSVGTSGFVVNRPNGSTTSGSDFATLQAAADLFLTNQPFKQGAGLPAAQADTNMSVAAGNVSNGDTLTLDGKVYTFQTVLTDVDGNILIGASNSDTMQNIIDAVNLTGTPGVQYAASMTKNTGVFMDPVISVPPLGRIKAITPGTAGNSIACTTTAANITINNNPLTGGVDNEHFLGNTGVWNWSIPNGDTVTAFACVTVPTTAIYWIGFSVDNEGTLIMDNETIIDIQSSGSPPNNLEQAPFTQNFWRRMELTAGNHVFEVRAVNTGDAASFQFHVLNNSTAELQAATQFSDLTIIGSPSDFDVQYSFNVSGGVECASGVPFYDDCTTPLCTECT